MVKLSLANPVALKEGKIYVLDETALPKEERYIEVNCLEDALYVLSSMKTRAFGQVLLFLYTSFVEGDTKKVKEAFSSRRPTFDFQSLSDLFESMTKRFGNMKVALEKILEEIERKRRIRAKNLAQILPHDAKILTICNVSGELVYLFEEMLSLGKKTHFFVSETRPYLQGTRLTYFELKKALAKTTLICDNQAAYLMENGYVNVVLTGSDRSTKSGDIVNKIGTYSLAVLSKIYNIPFYVLTQFPKDIDIREIKIEERPKEEVFMWIKRDDFPEALYPSFDIVPKELISKRVGME